MPEMHILHVEDDDNDVFLLRYAFEKAGLTQPLHVVKDGQEAMEYISGMGNYADRRQFPVPSLIILDLKMPRRNGIEFLHFLRAHPQFSHLPVIMLSSSAQPADVDSAYDAGVNSFLVKPAKNEDRFRLASAIKTFWVEFNLPPPKCADAYLQSHL